MILAELMNLGLFDSNSDHSSNSLDSSVWPKRGGNYLRMVMIQLSQPPIFGR